MIDEAIRSIRSPHRVLLVCGDGQAADPLAAVLEAEGFPVERAALPEEAASRLAVLEPSLIVVDLEPRAGPARLQGCERLLSESRSGQSPVPMIILTGPDEFAAAARLMAGGATDFLIKPSSHRELLRRVQIALLMNGGGPLVGEGPWHAGSAAPQRNGAGSVERGAWPLPVGLLIGSSAAIRRVMEQVELVAPKDTTVVISGETGTGKERVARAIHALSKRRSRAMVSVNCGGIPANLLEDEFFGHVKGAFTDAHQARLGRFEQAHNGTIFLDEIGDLPLELQPKLLRVVQEREIHRVGGVETIRIDTRIIAATNMDLWSRVQERGFREDLFYRINVFPIALPPLRERREDIPLFVDHFLQRFCRRDGLEPRRLDPDAEADLMSRAWPGNIRELENAVEIAVIRSQDRTVVRLEDFPAPRQQSIAALAGAVAAQPDDFRQLVARFERELIHRVLEHTHGNKTQAADLLRLKRTTLIGKLRKFKDEDEEDIGRELVRAGE